jgi:hypothetical protein
MQFGENLHKIHINTWKKNQEAVNFRNNNIKVLRFVQTEINCHLAQRLFFFSKKTCQTKSICLRIEKFLQNHHKDMLHKNKKFQGAASTMKVVIKLLSGVNLSGMHCSKIKTVARQR